MEYLQFSVFTKELHTRQVSGLRLKNSLTIFGTKIFPRAWQVSINQTNHPNQSKWTNSYGYSVALLQTSPWSFGCWVSPADTFGVPPCRMRTSRTKAVPAGTGNNLESFHLGWDFIQWPGNCPSPMKNQKPKPDEKKLTTKTNNMGRDHLKTKNLLKIRFKVLVNFGVEFTLVHVPSHPNS